MQPITCENDRTPPYSEAIRWGKGPTVMLCHACHRQIHVLFTNEELAGFYNTVERLQDHPDIKKYLHWVKKQDSKKRISTRKSNRRKRK